MINAELTQRVLDLAVTIQQIPAPTFAEHPRAEFVRQQFVAEGLVDVSIDEIAKVLFSELDWLTSGNLEAAAEILKKHFRIIERS